MLPKSVNNFFLHTSLHGLRHLADDGASTAVEKVIWTCVVALCVTASIALIGSSIVGSRENPFVTSLGSVPVQERISHTHNKKNFWLCYKSDLPGLSDQI